MIIVRKRDIPVACYDEGGPKKALKEYAQSNLPGSDTENILIDSEGTAMLEWQGEKYDASFYLEVY